MHPPNWRKYGFNSDAFSSINDEASAYWLGFLAADGSVGRWTMRLELATKDTHHVHAFAEWMECDAPIINVVNKGFASARLDINSVDLIRSLGAHGICRNKSTELFPPTTVPVHLIRHWARGLFDGDGHIGHYVTYKGARKENCRLVGSEHVIPWFAELVHTATGCPASAIVRRWKDRPGLTLVYSGRQRILAVCDWLYADHSIALQRKVDEIEFIRQWKSHATVSRKS